MQISAPTSVGNTVYVDDDDNDDNGGGDGGGLAMVTLQSLVTLKIKENEKENGERTERNGGKGRG